MPERKGSSQFDTSKVQGEGSYVNIRSRTVGEILMNVYEQEKQDTLWHRFGVSLANFIKRLFPAKFQERYTNQRDWAYRVIAFVESWNWVDSQGDPLPQPKDDPRVVEQLTGDELQCLIDCAFGNRQSEQQKN